jgi:MFS transporter, YNFM family, putative membrane transport protein
MRYSPPRASRYSGTAASAVYFTLYYVAGAAAGFLPGLAWEQWGWPGVALAALAALAVGLAALRSR